MTSGLASGHDLSGIPIYPAYCFSASPTFNKWVKLTAADIHALRKEREFEGQNIYFHLNHPIRYVYLVGPVVSIEVLADGKFFILTLDDGSGATIELKVERIFTEQRPEYARQLLQKQNLATDTKPRSTARDADNWEAVFEDRETDNSRRTLFRLVPFTAETTSQGVTIVSPCEDSHCYEMHGHVSIGGQIVDIGTIIKAKGRLQIWRDSFQLKLERAFLVQTTDEEALIWSEYKAFVQMVLSRPWKLTAFEIRALEAKEEEKALEEERRLQKAEQCAAKRSKKKIKWEEKRKLQEETLKKRRAREVEALNGNALDRRLRNHNESRNEASSTGTFHKAPDLKTRPPNLRRKVSKEASVGSVRPAKDSPGTSMIAPGRHRLNDKTNLP